ncbi:MAG: hypothetical protein HPY50_22305 [Firmicutes bacterium]|nr:hypothetical protein [Bacillota bacterium]
MLIKKIAARPFLRIMARPGAEKEEEDACLIAPGMRAAYSSGRLTIRALQAVAEKAG